MENRWEIGEFKGDNGHFQRSGRETLVAERQLAECKKSSNFFCLSLFYKTAQARKRIECAKNVATNELFQTFLRMPWHDIAVMVQGTAARDVGRHFIQRCGDDVSPTIIIQKYTFNL